MKTILSKLLFVLLGSIGMGYLLIYLSVFTSPDDLGQLMFVLFIFLPLVALATGVVSQIALRKILYTFVICLLSFSFIILTKYNWNGLVWVALYVFLGILGHYITFSVRLLFGKKK